MVIGYIGVNTGINSAIILCLIKMDPEISKHIITGQLLAYGYQYRVHVLGDESAIMVRRLEASAGLYIRINTLTGYILRADSLGPHLHWL